MNKSKLTNQKSDYQYTIGLKHEESPAIINKSTGEITEVSVKTSDKTLKDMSMKYFTVEGVSFQRTYNKIWLFLETQTTDKEFLVANKLALRAKAYTNSLEPLSPDSTLTDLSEELKVDRRIIAGIIDKLFKLGVIGKFEVYERNEQYKNYWIFNPYLSFNGLTIKKDVATLFDKTVYAVISKGLHK